MLVKELPLTVAVPKLARPPPTTLAELLVKVLPLTVAVPVTLVDEAAAEDVGGVAGEGAVAHRRRPGVGEAAAIEGGVASEGAVAHRRRPATQEVAAAAIAGGVASEGAVAHRRRPATSLARPPPGKAELLVENAVADRQRPEVVKAAAVPVPASPPLIVRPEMFTVSPLSTVKMRKGEAAGSRCTVEVLAPRPLG